MKQQRLEAEKQVTQKKLQLKQQEAQDNKRSSVDHGAVLEALDRALKATEAAFSEMATPTPTFIYMCKWVYSLVKVIK